MIVQTSTKHHPEMTAKFISLEWILILFLACVVPTQGAEKIIPLEGPREIDAAMGHTIYAKPSLSAKVLKSVPEAAKVMVAAYAEAPDGRFYISDWSWERYVQKKIEPNWIRIHPGEAQDAPGISEESKPSAEKVPTLDNGFTTVVSAKALPNVSAVCLATDAGVAITASRSLEIWSLRTGALLRTLPTRYEVHGVYRVPGTTRVITAEQTYKEGAGIFEYDFESGQSVSVLKLDFDAPPFVAPVWEKRLLLVTGEFGRSAHWVRLGEGMGRHSVIPCNLKGVSLACVFRGQVLVALEDGELLFVTPSGTVPAGSPGRALTWMSAAKDGVFFGEGALNAWFSGDGTWGGAKAIRFDLDFSGAMGFNRPDGKRKANPDAHLRPLASSANGDLLGFFGDGLFRIGGTPEVCRIFQWHEGSGSGAWDVDPAAGICLVARAEAGAMVLSTEDFSVIQELGQKADSCSSLAVSRDGRYLATVSEAGRAAAFDLQEIARIPLAIGNKVKAVRAGESGGEMVLLPAEPVEAAALLEMDLANGRITNLPVPGQKGTKLSDLGIVRGFASAGGSHAISFATPPEQGSKVLFWRDAKSQILTLDQTCIFPELSPNGRDLALPVLGWVEDHFAKLDRTGSLRLFRVPVEKPYFAAAFSSDGKKFAMVGRGGSDSAVGGVGVASVDSLAVAEMSTTIDDGTDSVAWRPGRDQVLFGGIRRYGNVQEYHLADATSGRVRGNWRWSTLHGGAADPAFSGDGRRLVIHRNGQEAYDICDVAMDGRIKVLATLVQPSAAEGEWIVFCPDGYYAASPGGAKLVTFVRGLENYPFDEFDALYNRPDLVMERLNPASKSLPLLRSLREYRTMKLAGRERADSSVEITAPGVPVARGSGGRFEFAVKAEGKDVQGIRLYVNGVPLAAPACEIRPGAQAGEFVAEVPLVAGRNKVQVAALGPEGAESRRETMVVMNSAGDVLPDLYVALVGVAEYQGGIQPLRWSTKDVRDIAATLAEQEGKAFREVHAKILEDSAATGTAITGLAGFFAQAGANDVALLCLAGHGVLGPKGQYEFVPVDATLAGEIVSGGVPFERLEALLKSSPSLKRAIVMDTCHSGDLVNPEAGAKLANAGSLEYLMQDHFSDLRRESGITVLAAAGAEELAREGVDVDGRQAQNGLFTGLFLDVLKEQGSRKAITLQEVHKEVRQRMAASGMRAQRPVFRSDNPDSAFVVAAPSHASSSARGGGRGQARDLGTTAQLREVMWNPAGWK